MNETKYSDQCVDIATTLCDISAKLLRVAQTYLAMAGINSRAQLMSSGITMSQVVSLAPLVEELE